MDHEINALIRFDAWLERGEGGTVPGELLRQRGIEIVESSKLDDAKLPGKLWELVEELAEIGIYLCFTDHLSDRELYERLFSDILPTETFLDPEDPWTGETCDLTIGGSEEDHRIYLTYYADDEDRRRWQAEFGDPLPAREPHPFDRDRFLPTMEGRLAELAARASS